eukprot:scaffold1386_cov77-Cyclotella_meneghiniana.AAC.9
MSRPYFRFQLVAIERPTFCLLHRSRTQPARSSCADTAEIEVLCLDYSVINRERGATQQVKPWNRKWEAMRKGAAMLVRPSKQFLLDYKVMDMQLITKWDFIQQSVATQIQSAAGEGASTRKLRKKGFDNTTTSATPDDQE